MYINHSPYYVYANFLEVVVLSPSTLVLPISPGENLQDIYLNLIEPVLETFIESLQPQWAGVTNSV